MTTSERRKAIIEVLSVRRHETIDNLAFEFQACRRTIANDVFELSLEYPIYTTKGTGGGVHVMEGASMYVENRYSTEQNELLQRIYKTLDGKDKRIMKGILLKYGKLEKEDV